MRPVPSTLVETARTWTPRALGVIAFAIYAMLAPPGLFWLDSQELSAAGFELGSAHPTGFPLYCTLVRLAGYLPFGELAYRAHLVSVAAGAITVYAVAKLLLTVTADADRQTAGPVVAVAGTFTLVGALLFARHATATEVYAPTAALVALTLLWFERAVRGGDARAGVALGVLGGLGLSIHVTYGLVLIPVAVHLGVRLYRGARWPLLVPVLVVTMAGAAYAMLPVRSATGRTHALDWDHPRTIGGVVRHLSAERIRVAFGDELRTDNTAIIGANASRFGRDVLGDVGVPALLFAAVGLFWLLAVRRTRWFGAAVAFLIAGDFAYSVWIHPMGIDDRQDGSILLVAAALAIGAGVFVCAAQFRRGAPFAAAVFAVIAATPAWFVSVPALVAGASGDAPRAFYESAIDEAPVRSVALLNSDSLAAGAIYLSAIEQARPDIAVIARQHLGRDSERTRAVLAAAGADLGGTDEVSFAQVRGLGRPLLWEIGADALPNGMKVVPGPAAVHLVEPDDGHPAGAGERLDLRDAARSLERIFSGRDGEDEIARRVHANALTGLGRLALSRRDVAAAELLFAAAIEVRPVHAAAYTNLAVVVGGQRDFARAADLSERAAKLEPLRLVAWVNAARYRLLTGDDDAAARHLARARQLDANSATAWALTGLVAARKGDLAAARAHAERALLLEPNNADARDLLNQLTRN